MLRFFLFLFTIMVLSVSLKAQLSTSFSLPSPNNSFLGKTDISQGIGVNLYTGTAQVNIPLCELPSKKMTIPISCSYIDGRGVKLQEYASQIGLGWQLNAGGVITRAVRGLPDEQTNGYLGQNQWGTPWGQLIANNWYGTHGISTYRGIGSLSYTQGSQLFGGTNVLPVADGEPDIFFVKTPFFSFQFVFDKDGQPVFSNTTGYKVITTNFFNSSTPYTPSFEVIDDQGNQFYFGSSSQTIDQASDTLWGALRSFSLNWYLDKIVTYNSEDTVTFSYQSAPNSDVTYNYSVSEQSNGGTTVNSLTTGKTSISVPKSLTTITSSLGTLTFNYSPTARQDDPNTNSLSNIVLRANGQILKTFYFNYTYFGLPSSDPNVLRLELSNITVAGNTTATSTPISIATFEYNTAVNLPNRTWPASDYWGYCNTTTNYSGSNVAIMPTSSDPTTTQADMLTSVTTAQGSKFQFTYESNLYSGIPICGVRVSKLSETLPTGENIYKTFKYLVPGSNSSSIDIYSTTYTQVEFQLTNSWLYVKSSPFISSDITGNFLGYSYVEEVDQNGGYIVSHFSNFSDAADAVGLPNNDAPSVDWVGGDAQPITVSGTNVSYKRGLLLDKSVYNSNDQLLSQLTNTYSPINSTIVYKAFGCGSVFLAAISDAQQAYFKYTTPIENYRLTKTVQKVYDQLNPTTVDPVTTTTTYAYDDLSAIDANNDNRLISQVTTTDSKSQTKIQKRYYSEDVSKTPAIPMITSDETNAINTMTANSRTNVLIHTSDNLNGTITDLHNSYGITQVGINNNVYLVNSAVYNSDANNTTPTLSKQRFYNYDATNGTMVSANDIGGAYTSFLYHTNSPYVTAKVANAQQTVAISNSSYQRTDSYAMPPYTYSAQTVSFNASAGNITVAIPSGSYLSNVVRCYFYFTLTGPSNKSGYICISSDGSYTCPSPSSITYSSMPAGIYTLTVTASTNTSPVNVPVNYTYPFFQMTATTTREFFYEDFESTGNVTSSAHTGNSCYSGGYTVPFTFSGGRNYLLQWWSYSGGMWSFNQQAYTGPVTLTGQIDDVRVFPADALMTTYSYSPIVGKTSETDPAGRTTYYEFDGLQRTSVIRDNDKNVTKTFDYQYQQRAAPITYPVTLYNQSQYPSGIVSATIDGVAYPFPASGASSSPVSLTAGTHTISLSNGPSSCYLIGSVPYSASQTNPPLNYSVSTGFTISYLNGCVNSVSGNLTSDATSTTACSCYGCQYSATIYYVGSLGVGTQLYKDSGLTQKVTGKTWFMNYSNSYVWPLSNTGVITGSSTHCP